MTYLELKELIKDKNLKSIKEWRCWLLNNRDKYPDIPLRPETSYKDFEGYIKFLNSGKVKRKEYLSYNESVEYLQKFKFTVKEFRKFIKENKDINIPTRPNIVYKDFTTFSDFLSNNNNKIEYYSYEECINFLKDKNIKTVKEFRKDRKKNDWFFIPSNPEKHFKNVFKSYNLFLSNNSVSNSKRNFLNYNEAKEYLKDKNLNNLNEYVKYLKEKKINFLPLRPLTHYKKDYISNGDYLSNGNVWSCFLHQEYDIEEIKNFIKDNNIESYKEYKIFIKTNKIKKYPVNLHTSLKDKGYKSSEDLFNKNLKQSSSENIIEKFLLKNEIIYEKQKRFKDCKYKRTLPFDFYLPNLKICIEYDGKQHFEPVPYWNGEKGLEITKLRDQIKTDYCIKNNIKLIRIDYNENIYEKLSKFLY